MVTAQVAHIASAMPEPISQRAMWDECFHDRYRNLAGAQRIWNTAGIETRHAAIDPRTEDATNWTTGVRMARYVDEAVPLATRAVTDVLRMADMTARDLDLFVVVSCTGYATPGVDLLLARDLDMSPDLQRLVVGHMGCYAALPALAAVADAVVAREMTALMVCVELTSLHVQPPIRDIGHLVSHALFSDAAVAMIVTPSAPGLRVVDIAARTDSAHQDAMSWHVTDLGFRMGLSPRVPAVLLEHVKPMVDDLLRRHDLVVADIEGWAIHPGGPRILDVCAEALHLSDDQMQASRNTLRDHGNCSSATVVLVVDRLLAEANLAVGSYVVVLAFGPGLTLYAALLQIC